MNSARTCKIDGCGKPVIARDWCCAHYCRWKRHGDPLGGRISEGEPLRWLREVALNHQDREACLKWPYGVSGYGYGQVRLDGMTQYVHRIICETVNGPPPTPEHEAAHSCGRGHDACCNKWHLRWATSSENHADKIEHGTTNRGERCGAAKLTESDVHEIRRLLASGMTQNDIGERFGVAREAISKIARGKRWAWLEDAA